MSDETTKEIFQEKRIKALEDLLERLDNYLNNHACIAKDSTAHREIKITLGRALWGERVVYDTDV